MPTATSPSAVAQLRMAALKARLASGTGTPDLPSPPDESLRRPRTSSHPHHRERAEDDEMRCLLSPTREREDCAASAARTRDHARPPPRTSLASPQLTPKQLRYPNEPDLSEWHDLWRGVGSTLLCPASENASQERALTSWPRASRTPLEPTQRHAAEFQML